MLLLKRIVIGKFIRKSKCEVKEGIRDEEITQLNDQYFLAKYQI